MLWGFLGLNASRFECFIHWKYLWFGFVSIWMLHDLDALYFGNFYGLDSSRFGCFTI